MKLTTTHYIIIFVLVILVIHLTSEYVVPYIKEPFEVRKKDIPPGDEDLYILKSEIVPPVCPKCPDMPACPKQKPCPPCPPCGRCPEPSFTCKKVPNYASSSTEYLPRPVLADFSQFGM